MAGDREVVVEMGINLPAPPQVVWDHLVDWERLGDWMHEATQFRVTTPFREGVGVEAAARIRIAGITTEDAIRVSRWEPPEWLEIQHLGWVKGSGLMHCRPAAGGSYLWWRETLAPPWGLLGAVGMATLRPVMRGIFARDLRLLRRLLDTAER